MDSEPESRSSDGAPWCARCGRPFRPTRANAKYCTVACRLDAGLVRRAERRRATEAEEGERG